MTNTLIIMTKHVLVILFLIAYISMSSQETEKISLDQIINLAEKQSLDAFKAKNMYLANYWEYRSFKATQLPSLDLNLQPIEFRRMMTKRYDFDQNIDIFREQKTMESYANLALSQYIPYTGGTVYIDSDLSRLVNYTEDEVTTFSATLVRIGLNQPIFGFNEQKWAKKLSPLKFEKAKQEYIQSMQETKLKALDLFFNLLLVKIQKEIAESNVATADTLYKVGKRKFAILSTQREELLDLELSKFNAEIEVVKANQNLEKAKFSLNSFLGLENTTNKTPITPSIINDLYINQQQAIEIALKSNPDIIGIKQNQIEADRNLDKAIKENRFSASLMASFGLNQNAEVLPEAYINPLDQQVLVFGIKIPILDWGNRKGKKQMAQSNREVTYIESKQQLSDFKQNISLKILDFNLQAKIVQSAAKANDLANESYQLTKKRFLLGEADVLKVTNSMQARQSAQEKYIISIYTFWKYYYEIQQLTLYDFKENKNISIEFEKLIEK
ncbi:MAG: TolC family protein [Bacteroidales bacterium]|nr:TolC family protein [Bacteroidales bacterium]